MVRYRVNRRDTLKSQSLSWHWISPIIFYQDVINTKWFEAVTPFIRPGCHLSWQISNFTRTSLFEIAIWYKSWQAMSDRIPEIPSASGWWGCPSNLISTCRDHTPVLITPYTFSKSNIKGWMTLLNCLRPSCRQVMASWSQSHYLDVKRFFYQHVKILRRPHRYRCTTPRRYKVRFHLKAK